MHGVGLYLYGISNPAISALHEVMLAFVTLIHCAICYWSGLQLDLPIRYSSVRTLIMPDGDADADTSKSFVKDLDNTRRQDFLLHVDLEDPEIARFTTDMLEDEDGGSGTWVWPTPTSIILGFPAVELTRFERRRAEQYQQDYLCWLNGERCSAKTRGAYYRLVSKVEVHRRGAAVDPYVYAGGRVL